MFRSAARSPARLLRAPLPEYPDRSPMPPEEHEQLILEYSEGNLGLGEEFCRAMEREEEERRIERYGDDS